MERLLWICVAGGAGCGARYLLGLWAAARFGTSFPYGTLLVNLSGCFLMGLLMQLSLRSSAISPELRLALGTGFLGGLTTYSSFNYETTQLAQAGAHTTAIASFLITALGCALAGLLGQALAARLL